MIKFDKETELHVYKSLLRESWFSRKKKETPKRDSITLYQSGDMYKVYIIPASFYDKFLSFLHDYDAGDAIKELHDYNNSDFIWLLYISDDYAMIRIWSVADNRYIAKTDGVYFPVKAARDFLKQNLKEDLELDVADAGVPSLHSKKDDRYGHHNYKIEDPDLKRRLAEANPHLAKFLDDHYVWYLIAWAKGIEDGTSYQGFLNIFDDENRWTKVHGSYSDGYRPEPDLVKDIVFNSIEEDLDLDVMEGDSLLNHIDDNCVLTDNLVGKDIINIKNGKRGWIQSQSPCVLKVRWESKDNKSSILTAYPDKLAKYIIVPHLDEELDLDVSTGHDESWREFVIEDNVMNQALAEEVIEAGRYSYSWWFDLYRSGEDEYYSGNVGDAMPIGEEYEGFFQFNEALELFEKARLEPGDVLYLDFYPDEELEKEYADMAVLVRRGEEIEEDLELDPVEYDYDPSYLVKSDSWDSTDLIATGMSKEEEDKENWVKRWGLAPGKWIIKRYETFNDAYVDFLNYKFEPWEDQVDLTCEDAPVLRRYNKTNEALDLDVPEVNSKLDFKDVKAPNGRYIAKRALLPEDRKMLLYNLLSEIGDATVFDEFLDNDKYDWEITTYPPTNGHGEHSYLNFREKLSGHYTCVSGFGIFGFFIPEDIAEAVLADLVTEDLDLDIVPYNDDWKVYHDTLDNYFSLPIYDAELLIRERAVEVSWFLAYYVDGNWRSGAYQDLPDGLNGFMTFDEAFKKFKETEIGEDERLVVCYHQGAEYDENDELDFGEEDYPILAKGSEATEAQLFEDIDLDVLPAPHEYDSRYLCDKGKEEVIYEHGNEDANWYLITVNREGFIDNGALDELHMCNGEGSFSKMYEFFTSYEFEWDEEKVYLMYDDGIDDVHEVMCRYNTNPVDEDLDLDPLEYDNLLEPYLTKLTDEEVLDKLEETYNIYVLPNGKVGFVANGEIDQGSELEDEVFDYIEDSCIYIWGSSDSLFSNINHLFVEFPKHRLTQSQVDFLLRNKEWLWESRIPEDSDEFAGTSDHEYATDYWGYYGISTNDSETDKVDDYLTIHGYANITEDLDLDVTDNKPELLVQYENKDRYKLDDSHIVLIKDIIREVYGENSGKYEGIELTAGSARDGDEVILVVWHTSGPGAILSYEIRVRSLIYEAATVRWDGNLDEMAVARDIDKAFGFNYLNEYENKYLNEDLELDVQSMKPEEVCRGTEAHRKYRISMAALYRIRELKKDVYGEDYGINGGYYLDNLIDRVEEGDEDLAGDIYLEVFDNTSYTEYRLSFGEYCICTLCQFSPMEFKGNLEVELARQIEEEMSLPKLTDSVKEMEFDIGDLLNLDDVKVDFDEGLDLEVTPSPTEKFIGAGTPIDGCYRIGYDNKTKVIDYLRQHEGTHPSLIDAYSLCTDKEWADRLEDVITEIWIYFPEDTPIDDGSTFYKLKNHLVILLPTSSNSYQLIPDDTVRDLLINGAVDTVMKKSTDETNEDLDLDVVDSNALDDKIREVIQRFLLDMGEYCVIIGDTVFEGSPMGIRNSEGRYEPCRDTAFKVHEGEVTLFFPDNMQNNQEEVDEWNRIESAAIIDKVTDPEPFLRTYTESTTTSYEKAIYNLGDTWGYTREETENEFLSKI